MKTLSLPSDSTASAESDVPWPQSASPPVSPTADDYFLYVEPMLSGIELAAGSAKLSRYMAKLGSPVVGLIENHPGKILFLGEVLPGVQICDDYYSHSYEYWPVWSVDWVGGGPPCVWCSRAGKQE